MLEAGFHCLKCLYFLSEFFPKKNGEEGDGCPRAIPLVFVLAGLSLAKLEELYTIIYTQISCYFNVRGFNIYILLSFSFFFFFGGEGGRALLPDAKLCDQAWAMLDP